MHRIRLAPCLLAFALFAWASPADAPSEPSSAMALQDAIILGVVEGLTEYLPVSSTGHLLLTQRLLGIGTTAESKVAADSYAIVIQIGAILAVVSLYRELILQILLGISGKSREGRQLLRNLLISFFPAAVVGLTLGQQIKALLFGLWPVTFAWFVGGILLVTFRSKGSAALGNELKDLSPKQSLVIGVVQCAAAWPGTSRSLVTILGGRWMGLSVSSAVTYSFLLGMVTLGASTAYDSVQHGKEMVEAFGLPAMLVGIVVGWASAWLAVKWMVAYLQKHGLALFGFYRIGIAVVTAILLLTKTIPA